MNKSEKLKRRADLAIEICKQLVPELHKHSQSTFVAMAKQITLLPDSDFSRIAERSVITKHSVRSINGSVADFKRMNDLYLDERGDIKDALGESGSLDLKEEYPKGNIPVEKSDGRQVNNAEYYIGDIAEVVRKVLREELSDGKALKDAYPAKNIPVESSVDQSSNSVDVRDKEVQKIIDTDEAEAMSRAETQAAGGQMGDGLVLYEEVKEGYSGYTNYKGSTDAGDEPSTSSEEADMAALFGDENMNWSGESAGESAEPEKMAVTSANKALAKNSIPSAILASRPATKSVDQDLVNMEKIFGTLEN